MKILHEQKKKYDLVRTSIKCLEDIFMVYILNNSGQVITGQYFYDLTLAFRYAEKETKKYYEKKRKRITKNINRRTKT